MFVKRKKNRSGSTSVVVVDKIGSKYKYVTTIGISNDPQEIERMVEQGQKYIKEHLSVQSPEIDFDGAKEKARRKRIEEVQTFISDIDKILLNGHQQILNRVFDSIGFQEVEDDIFRNLVWHVFRIQAARKRR